MTTTQIMTTYRMTSRTSGAYLGAYLGANFREALEALYRDAGYADAQDAADTLGTTVEALRADLIVEVVLPPGCTDDLKAVGRAGRQRRGRGITR